MPGEPLNKTLIVKGEAKALSTNSKISCCPMILVAIVDSFFEILSAAMAT